MTYKMLTMFIVLTLSCTSFNLYAEEPAPPSPAAATTGSTTDATRANAVAVQNITFENGAIRIVTDGKLSSFTSFRLAKPARLVIDLPGVTNQLSNQVYENVGPGLSAKVAPYGDRLRLIIEAGDSQLFPDINIDSTTTGLIIKIAEKATTAVPHTTMPHIPPATPAKKESSSYKPGLGGAVISGGHIASVKIERSQDNERIILNISGRCPVSDPQLVLNGISVSFGDCVVPANWQGIVDPLKDHPAISAITLFPASDAKRVEAGMLIELGQKTKFSFSKEKQRLVIDLDITGIEPPTAVNKDAQGKKSGSESLKLSALGDTKLNTKKYAGKKVSMEFDSAEIRHVFRLLADISGENFVISDEIKGTFSIKLKEVPWEQALEIILRNNELAMIHTGNVVEILTKQKKMERDKIENDLRLQETRQKLEEKAAKEAVEGMSTRTIQLKHATAEKMAKALLIMLSEGTASVNTGQAQQQAQQLNQGQTANATTTTTSDIQQKFTASIYPEPTTNKLIVRDYLSKIAEIEKLIKELDVPERQVMIEARIVVATSEFTKDFGIQWGAHFKDGSASVLGINSIDSGFGGLTSSVPPSSGQFGTTSGIATGISFGKLSNNIQLDMRLSAATAANTIKVVASPRIVTLNHEPAKIEQGQSTFVQTTTGTGASATTSMTPALATLKLEVTPSINSSNDSLKLKIDASDDSFGTPPPGASSVAINKRTTTSTLLLKDGETVVIGGIFREQNSDNNSGVPFLMDIPLLGYLFQNKSSLNKREELLIFLRPKIIDLI